MRPWLYHAFVLAALLARGMHPRCEKARLGRRFQDDGDPHRVRAAGQEGYAPKVHNINVDAIMRDQPTAAKVGCLMHSVEWRQDAGVECEGRRREGRVCRRGAG